ncbi:glycosyltransferase family 25 protein [Pararhizobium haloflavum]|uniref:glycosyltransferase family 25 protein n=1 Tax=Pararhizobium haloflavum TaxID=2037914 RepID=UPI0018E492D4|nr:glycosyltransferase family 25 protein [Pararhizobium haloflavum]
MLPIFVINLDRSEARWRVVTASAEKSGLTATRVPGFDGAAVAPADWQEVDPERFNTCHGRRMLPGEYGCYRGHLAALDRVIAEGAPLAIICEDDITLNARLIARAEALARAARPFDAIKLINHRVQGFVQKGVSEEGDAYGRCLHGPQGSAACYLVTLEGAKRLRAGLSPMWLPYDVALERGWAFGANVLTVRDPLVAFSGLRAQSNINTDAASTYDSAKPPIAKRWPTAAFRGADYAKRVAYALKRI